MDLKQLATHDDIKSLRNAVIGMFAASALWMVVILIAVLWLGYP